MPNENGLAFGALISMSFQNLSWKIFHQQDVRFKAEGARQFVQPIDCDAILLAFQRTDICPINLCGVRQCFLRHAPRCAKYA